MFFNEKFCEHHSNSPISHMCISKNCFTPLCAKCIKTHNEFHKSKNEFPELETLEDLKEICYQKIKIQLEDYKTEIKQELFSQKQQTLKNFHQNIVKLKSLLIEIMTDVFEDFKENFITNLNSFNFESHNKQSFLKLEQKLAFLRTDNFSFDLLREILTTDHFFPEKLNKNEDKPMENWIFSEKNVQNFAFNFRKSLNQQLFQQQTGSFSSQTKKIEITATSLTPEKITNKFPKNIKELEKIKKSDNVSERLDTFQRKFENENNEIAFKISKENYFDSSKTAFLHFFQPKSKTLHFFWLVPSKIHYFTKEIAMNFGIPRWHKSIATPSGRLFLLGGASLDIKASKLSNLYEYIFENNSLNQKSPMKMARSGFGLVFLKDFLYIMGGNIDQTQSTSKCEKYDVFNDKWTEIANLNLPACNFGACTVNNTFIYKFGGKIDDNFLAKTIEKFNPKVNKWFILNYRHQNQNIGEFFKVLASSGCCQINKNSIFVFGGVEEEFHKKSKQTFILEIDERDNKSDYVVKDFNENGLLFKDVFYESNALIHDSALYSLQNLSSEADNGIVLMDKKRVLMFDGEKWNCLN